MTALNYIVEASKFDAARPFRVRCTTPGVLGPVKGYYATKAAANARLRSLERA